MERHAADGMDEALGQSLLLTYCRQSPRHEQRGLFIFTGFAGKKRCKAERPASS